MTEALDSCHVAELFAACGPVIVRRMLGAASIYADGVMFALVAGDKVHFNADEGSIPDFRSQADLVAARTRSRLHSNDRAQ